MKAMDSQLTVRPDIFSRGALELTFKLLRPYRAGLALDIQNQLQDAPVPSHQSNNTTQKAVKISSADQFFITLEPQAIGKIVAALTSIGNDLLSSHTDESGNIMVVRALMKDWIELAEWVILQVGEPVATPRKNRTHH